MSFLSRWLGRESNRAEDTPAPVGASEQATPPRTLTIGERVDRAAQPSPYFLGQRCVLCKGDATVETGDADAQITCRGCGAYRVALDAAFAFGALVTYHEPATAEMRKMLESWRQRHPQSIMRITVQYVVDEGVPTFCVASD